MRVKDLMTRRPITIEPETPVLEAQYVMRSQRVRHLLVLEHGQLAGIVTDRDIRLNLPSPATSLSIWELNHLLARLTVKDVMTRTVITVESTRDARQAAAILVAEQIGALPVVDAGLLVGIVTETDFLRSFVGAATSIV